MTYTDEERDETVDREQEDGHDDHPGDDHEAHDHEGHDHDHDPDHEDVEHEAEVEQVGSRVTMKITVDAETVSSHVDEVAGIFRQRSNLPGFRRGKAPMSMIRQQFKDEIEERVLEHMLPVHIGAEIRSRELKPIHNPVLDNVEFEPGKPLTLAAHFDVEPEVEVSGYKDLTGTKTVMKVTDEAVESALGELRERAAKLDALDEDNEIQVGDYVSVSMSLFPRDGKGKKLAEEDRLVKVGEERAVPGLNTQLEGQKAGSTREFVTELGDSYPNDLLAGKEVTCRVEVREAKRRILPAVDDEMARDLGFTDLDELRTKTHEDYVKHVDERAETDLARQLMDQVLAANQFDVPESMVENRLEESIQRTAEELARQGVDPRKSFDWAAYRADNLPHAQRAVSEEIALDGIIDAEGLEVEDADVLAEIQNQVGSQEEGAVATLAQRMRKEGSFEGLRRAMLRRRALDFVKSHATIETVEVSPDAAPEASD